MFNDICLFAFSRVEDNENLLEMPDEDVTQLNGLRSSYVLCTCEKTKQTDKKEAVCTKEKIIACDVFKTKPLQRNTCHAKRKRRSSQTHISYIPNNFVEHHIRQKACNHE